MERLELSRNFSSGSKSDAFTNYATSAKKKFLFKYDIMKSILNLLNIIIYTVTFNIFIKNFNN